MSFLLRGDLRMETPKSSIVNKTDGLPRFILED